jgi:dephospho-CoA kinase
MMTVLGLTGSIGMGKSEAAKAFVERRIPVFDADKCVHQLFEQDEDLQALINDRFAGVVENFTLDREKLAQMVFGDDGALRALENIVHPAVAAKRTAFLLEAEKNREKLVVLDVPLLFETGGERYCHKVAVVSTTREKQIERVMKRDGMTRERFNQITLKQMPDAEKRARADYIIATGSFEESTAVIDKIIRENQIL